MRRFSKSKFYQLRKELRLTLRKLMFATGVPATHLSMFEHGRVRRDHKIDKAIKYMEGLINERN